MRLEESARGGVDVESGDGGDVMGFVPGGAGHSVGAADRGERVAQRDGGVGAGGPPGAVDGHAEPVAAGVDGASGGFGGLVAFVLQFRQLLLGGGDGGGQRPLVAGVGAFEPLQAGDLGVEFGVLEDAWVSGGERLDFGVGQRGVADVFDLANVEGAAHDLGDEPGFAFYGLPEICVKARLRSHSGSPRPRG